MDPIVRGAIARIDIVQGGRSGSRGTGFLVAPDLVLTAVHVVADRSAATLTLLPGQITLTFPSHRTEATVVDGHVDPRADWILLRCSTPPPHVRPIPLADSVEDGAPWETFGFPDANPRDGLAQIGTVTHAAGNFEGIAALQLFSEQAAGGGGAPVKGASGGPVIVDGAVVALLRASLMKDGLNVAGTLYGCPIELVLERSGALLPIPDPVRGLPGLPRHPLPPAPFRFLERFTSRDAEIFFGRNREIRQLYDHVVAEGGAAVVLLYGQSGSGKSSFLDAGLLPRLESTHVTVYLRRDREKGLLRTLLDALSATVPAAAGSLARTGGVQPAQALRLAWLGTETAAGRPLVVVLDQVEEVFTLPSDNGDELSQLIDALTSVFEPGAARGRLLLGFRKEWFAEIQKQLDARGVDYGKVFLEALDRDAVAEIVSGLGRTKRLRERYGLECETGLAPAVARDLTADRDSPVAPTLQVLLSRMWTEATAVSATAPRFSLALYERVRTEGFLLGDFLDQQLDAVGAAAAPSAARADVVESGLALDVLVFHTTPFVTAEQHGADDVAREYRHRPADAAWLVQELKRGYLLTDPAGEGRDIRNAARLAHDTLAQVVRARFDKSGHAGQRARRILENRAAEWSDGRTGTVLDARDLALVEQGLGGMRALHPNEEMLVHTSRTERERESGRQRLRRIAIAGAAAAVLAAAAVAGWFGLQNRRQMEWRDMLTLDARIPSLLTTDPVAALVAAITVVDRGLTLNRESLPVGLQVNLASALDQARERQSWSLGSASTALAFSSDGRIAAGSGEGLIHLFQLGTPVETALIRAAGDSTTVQSLSFSPDASYLAAALGRQGIGVWDRKGHLLTALPNMPDGFANVVRFVPAGADAATASHTLVALFTPGEFLGRSTLYVCDLDSDVASSAAIVTAHTIESLSVARTSRGEVWAVTGSSVGENDGELRLWDAKTGRVKWTQPSATSKGGFAAVDIFISPDAAHTVFLAGGASDGTVSVWDVAQQHATVIGPFDGRPAITSLAFGGQGHVVLAGTANGLVRWLALDGVETLPAFPASSSPVIALAPSPDHQLVAVGGASLDLHRVRVVDQIAVEVQFPLRHPGSAESRVNDMAFAPDSHRLVVAGRDRVTSWDVDLPRGAPWSRPTMMDVDVGGKESRGVALGRAGEMLIVADRELQFHRADGGLAGTAPLPSRGTDISVSSDGLTAAVGDDGGHITLWDVARRRVTTTLQAHQGSVLAVAFNAAGDRLATAAEDGHLKIWRRDGTMVADEPQVSATALAYESDGTLFVGRKDGQLGRRQADGSPIVSVPIFRGELITSVFVQRGGGDAVIVAGKNGVSRFDVASGAVLAGLAPGKDIRAVAGSADGQLLAAVDTEGTVIIFRADWREWLSESCDRLRQHDVFQARGSSSHCRPDGASREGTKEATRPVYGVDCREAYSACVARAWIGRQP